VNFEYNSSSMTSARIVNNKWVFVTTGKLNIQENRSYEICITFKVGKRQTTQSVVKVKIYLIHNAKI
jgi:hypothetical protein